MATLYAILIKTSSVASSLLLSYTDKDTAVAYLKKHGYKIVEQRKYAGLVQWFVN